MSLVLAAMMPEFLSTSPARGTTRDAQALLRDVLRISIHVPREGDDGLGEKQRGDDRISIHVPREGDDRSQAWAACSCV